MTTRTPSAVAGASVSPPPPQELLLGLAVFGSIERRGTRVFQTTAVETPGGMVVRETDVTNLFNFTAPPRPTSPAQRRSKP